MTSNNSNLRAPFKAPESPAGAPPLLAAIRLIQPRSVFYSDIRALMAGRGVPLVVETLPEVGRAFGVSAATVRINWRQDGMPGSNGSYDLAEIACWRLIRDAENAGRPVHHA